MTRQSTPTAFAGSMPEAYDRFLGPYLFEFSAADLAQRVAGQFNGPIRLLEVACGTGISTRHLANRLDPGSTIDATDLSDAMLAHAQDVNGNHANVRYRQADALDLPFDDAVFDAVVCPFGIMFFPDRAKGMEEMTRVLKPGGLLALNIWDGFDGNPGAKLIVDVIRNQFDGDPPRFLEVPYETVTQQSGEAMYRQAGFGNCTVTTLRENVPIDDLANLARGFVTGNPTILELKARSATDPEEVIALITTALEAEFGKSPTVVPMQAAVFLGIKPAA